jgi:hypothetical protein
MKPYFSGLQFSCPTNPETAPPSSYSNKKVSLHYALENGNKFKTASFHNNSMGSLTLGSETIKVKTGQIHCTKQTQQKGSETITVPMTFYQS